MASVFLSYVREDSEKARAIAAILERSGHAVWWDRQIKGGAQYSSEIEAALNAADKVLVLWSAQSVQSAWVRDEAAAGRDSGRLVPINLDGTPPPLGFRQFQTIDLSQWKGRGRSARVEELLDCLGPASPLAPAPDPPPAPLALVPLRTRAGHWRWLIAVALALLAAVIGGGWWWANRGEAHAPIVAIEAANESQTSRQVAHDLSVRLGDLQSARGDAFQLISGAGDADVIIQVDASDGSGTLRRALSVLSGANRSILWSTSFEQPRDKADELSQQLTVTSDRVLSCALEALSNPKEWIDPPTLKLYLGGCSRLQDIYGLGQYDPALVKLFEQVIAKAPHFEGAWAKLLATESEAVRNPDPPRILVDKLRQHIGQAEKLGLASAEVYAAKASLLPQNDFLGVFAMLKQGMEANPANPYLLRLYGDISQKVGRMNDAIDFAGRALELDPLSPVLQDNFISALAYGGRIEAAYTQLAKAEAMWPGASNIQVARYRLDLRYGDAKRALAFNRSQAMGAGGPAMATFLMARIDPSPANIQRSIDDERVQYAQEPRYLSGLVQALAQFGRKDEAIELMLHYARLDGLGYNAEVLFRPAMRDVWRDPRSMAAAAHLGFVRYWKISGKWPDFCSDPTLPYDCRKEAAKYS